MSDNPLIPKTDDEAKNPAVELIRSKVERAYTGEPDAVKELAEVKEERVLSKHQQFMAELSASGKSLADIQTEWHRYYTQLPDAEKHEVWQEFYAANQNTPYQKLFQKQQAVASRKLLGDDTTTPSVTGTQPTYTPPQSDNGVVVADHTPVEPTKVVGTPKKPHRKSADLEAARKLKQTIASRVDGKGRLTMKHHLQSLGFGLASGCIVLILFLFTFFNQLIIAPFIQPSRKVSSTPIILSDATVDADAPPSVTIPKINIQIPVDFSVPTTDETAVETGLKHGVVHYPNTVLPGQNGNASYFGHSSGNILNNEKYFFSFTLLHDLTSGDLFYINYQGKTYAYRVFDKQVVPPTAVSVITDTRGKQATAELITCDPPGISTNRLVVWGEQISPNPATNTTPTVTATVAAPAQIAGNGPSLWSKMISKLEFWKQ